MLLSPMTSFFRLFLIITDVNNARVCSPLEIAVCVPREKGKSEFFE